MRISAKVDYAVRGAIELAGHPRGRPVKRSQLASVQDLPDKFLETILAELRQDGIISSQRGTEGGYWLVRDPAQVTVADIIRAVEGPLAEVRGARPEALDYDGSAAPLQRVWIALRANLRGVLEQVTLADLATGRLPEPVERLAADEANWQPH